MSEHKAASTPGHLRTVASRLQIGPVKIRRGVLFLVNIGVPVVVGAARGEPQAALLGAVVGMLLGFADNDGALASRLRLLMIDAGALAAGTILGYFSRSSAMLWPVFMTISLAAGMATRLGREPLIASRHGVMAFTVAASIPTFEIYQIWYLLGVLAVSAVSRGIDYLLFGPLPRLPPAPLQMPSGHGGWLRFALAFAGAATASLWMGGTIDPVHRIWVVTTTLVVMQPDARASYIRIVQRIAGTFAGMVVAWAITVTFHSRLVICAVILLVAPLIPHHLTRRYWLHTGLIALMVMLAYDLAEFGSKAIEALMIERVKDILIGCAIALVGTAIAFPRAAMAEVADAVGLDGPSNRDGDGSSA